MFVASLNADAQQFEKIKTIKSHFPVVYATIDRVGDLYILSSQGQLEKINSNGDVEATTTLSTFPTSFDPRDGSRLFVYWRPSQKFTYLLPNLETNRSPTSIDSAVAVSPFLVAPSGENDLLVLDSVDWSLKKINGRTNTVSYETIIHDDKSPAPTFSFLREYQNFVFLLDKRRGILVYNMMGRLLKTIGGPGIETFSSLGEELYYHTGDALFFYDLFTTETRQLKLPRPANFAFLTDTRLYIVLDNEVELYSVK
jgi:hypothetical protein